MSDNYGVYGARKVWKQLHREGTEVARCTVERLMRADRAERRGPRGHAPARPRPDPAAARPEDLVERKFVAQRPDQLWVVDFTYVADSGRVRLRRVLHRRLLLDDHRRRASGR